MSHTAIKKELREIASPEIAEHSQRFFKTGPGEYGEGDKFIGVRVPVLRKIAKKHRDLKDADTLKLLKSEIHEERLLALIILTLQYERGDKSRQAEVYDLYCEYTDYVNNWDLVDSSAHKIVGPYLVKRSKKPLDDWSRSDNMWERRIAMMATYHFIKLGEFKETLKLAKRMLKDPEDLMHKSIGWMLREVGNKDRDVEEEFLKKHYQQMPRTMLRYAIEKFPEPLRKAYLHGEA